MVRVTLIFVLLLASTAYGKPQSSETTYKGILNSNDDHFIVKINYPFHIEDNQPDTFIISSRDTIDLGTGGMPGLSATVATDSDSLQIQYENFPFTQIVYVPIHSPKASTHYRLHFNGVNAYFSPEYIAEHNGKASIEIPEIFELANILWTLSPSGQRANDLNRTGKYYSRVIAHFSPFLNHPIFKLLDFPDSIASDKYYDFRENSFCYHFAEANGTSNKIVYEGPYYYVMGDDWDNYINLFGQLKPLVEDFVRVSGYREFYRRNIEFYATQIKRMDELLPVKSMWQWLEHKNPDVRYNAYKIVFSPLIGGSHSTQNFGTYSATDYYSEAIMFVCGPSRYDSDKAMTETIKMGLMTGIVFTEIDHNYVNPVSFEFGENINEIFSDRNIWAKGLQTKSYNSSMSVFNEYMTHSLYCLYLLDTYDRSSSNYLIEKRESLMADIRGFNRFKEFNQALVSIYLRDRSAKLVDLYAPILAWSSKQE